ncbi:MAG: endopeptidase La [Candidatus Anammoximicrobium sp.]|nr:endopeptidase La [Candidatus Anammoximicrobium sp.]
MRKDQIHANEDRQRAYPVLPIRNSVLFPKLILPLTVGRPASLTAIDTALAAEDKTIVVVAQRDPATDDISPDDLYEVGTLATIKKIDRQDDTMHLLVFGTDRVVLGEAESCEPYLRLKVRRLPKPKDETTEVDALHREVLEVAGKISELLASHTPVALIDVVMQTKDMMQQLYLLASLLSMDVSKAQTLLAASTRQQALERMHEFLSYELQVLQLRHKIASQASTEIGREQREYLLRQQMKAIQEELGGKSPEEAETEELRRRMEEAELPDKVRQEAEKELRRLERMSPNAADYQVTRTYLDLVLELPWHKTTEDNLDLPRARMILDEDHFNLKEVKQRIVEHLAVMKLNPEAKAPILCFVGPPGVGKTSLGQSIARALGREFERLALGGLHDEAELRGHRRTYIGAMPGRILQAIRRAGVKNPLLMLDEIDKLGRDYRGDPAAALMEILDPAQNHAFHDNYLDLPFDLSKVFFITTANTLDSIPRPLLDRMEVLRLPGYSAEEKREIAERYLIPRQVKEAGLASGQISLPRETLHYVIGHYTREAGVRELERTLGRIARKVATSVVEGRTEPTAVAVADLGEMLGPERFLPEKARQRLAPGVAAGLAWTEAGGDVLYVEAILLPNGKDLRLTGQLGEVMRESAEAAQSYILSRGRELGIDKKRLEKVSIHIHVPAGATPKDGPSAGITMAVALASLLTDCPARSDTAMTGEITLSGLVFPVGGIKEKMLAAHRAGVRRVILPKANEKDLRELPDHVRQDMEFIFAENIDDVLSAAIPKLAEHPSLMLV